MKIKIDKLTITWSTKNKKNSNDTIKKYPMVNVNYFVNDYSF